MSRLSQLKNMMSAVSMNVIVTYLAGVAAAPTSNSSASGTGSSSNDNGSNKNGGFQILADGTQDLTALVGLFATDGVEKYAVDYTRGFLPPVTAPLSLHGLLGYVSALLKLSFGVEVCEGNGFSITALRSYAGVRNRDEDVRGVTEVHCLERMILDSSVQWGVAKSISHTNEGMPLIAGDCIKALRDR